jgi:gliding motility-associated lipoprotein GldH
MKKVVYSAILALIILSSCNSGKIYEKYYDIDRITWTRFDMKTFTINIDDISRPYDFYVLIRHHTEFPFPAIDIRFTINTPSGEMRTMVQEIVLKDKEGNLLGDGMGDLWDVVFPVRKGFQFTEKGECTVEVSSAMSKADLPGILQVGLIVRQSNKR